MIRLGSLLLGAGLLLAGTAHAERPPGVQQVIYIDVDLTTNASNIENHADDPILQRRELIDQLRELCVKECACWDWALHAGQFPMLKVILKTNAPKLRDAALTAAVFLENPQGHDFPICTVPPLEVCPPAAMASYLGDPSGKELYAFIAKSLKESFLDRIDKHRGHLRRAKVPVATGIVQLTTDGSGAVLPLPWDRLSPRGSFTFRIQCPRDGKPSLEICAQAIEQAFLQPQGGRHLLTVYYTSLKDPADPTANLNTFRDKLKDLDYGDVYWTESSCASSSDFDQ
jgi:hypothetical protein